MEPLRISDFDCPICLSLLLSPLKTPCNHTFCSYCIEELFDLSSSGSIQCPICRETLPNNSILMKDKEKEAIIKTNFRDQLEAKEKDISSLLINSVSCRFEIGNWHRSLVTSNYNRHEWTFFVKFESPEIGRKLIDKIVVTLHPTFADPIITLTAPPFEIKMLGWGVFDIPVRIHWKAWTGLPISDFSHYLSFNGNGEARKFKVKIDRTKFEKKMRK